MKVMVAKSRKSNKTRGDVNVRKIALVLLCLLVLIMPTFGQLNEFELPGMPVHLLSIEGQSVAVSDNVLATFSIDSIDLTASIGIEAVLISNLRALTIKMISDADIQRTLGFSQEHAAPFIMQRKTRGGLGGVAVRLKGPMYSTSSVVILDVSATIFRTVV